jgi:hypothetical protein
MGKRSNDGVRSCSWERSLLMVGEMGLFDGGGDPNLGEVSVVGGRSQPWDRDPLIVGYTIKGQGTIHGDESIHPKDPIHWPGSERIPLLRQGSTHRE